MLKRIAPTLGDTSVATGDPAGAVARRRLTVPTQVVHAVAADS